MATTKHLAKVASQVAKPDGLVVVEPGEEEAFLDPLPVEPHRRAGSVGAQSALGRRAVTPTLLCSSMGHLADRVARRLRAAGKAGRTVTIRVRFRDMRSVTRSTTLPAPISTTRTLAELGVALVEVALEENPGEREITLVAISVSNLADQATLPLELALGLAGEEHRPGTPVAAGRWAVDRAMDAVRARYGNDAVGFAASSLGERGGTPDEFRELAE